MNSALGKKIYGTFQNCSVYCNCSIIIISFERIYIGSLLLLLLLSGHRGLPIHDHVRGRRSRGRGHLRGRACGRACGRDRGHGHIRLHDRACGRDYETREYYVIRVLR